MQRLHKELPDRHEDIEAGDMQGLLEQYA